MNSEIIKLALEFLGCLAIRAVRKHVSAEDLLHQTNPPQSVSTSAAFWGLQIESVDGGTHPWGNSYPETLGETIE